MLPKLLWCREARQQDARGSGRSRGALKAKAATAHARDDPLQREADAQHQREKAELVGG